MDITALTAEFIAWANEIILSLGYLGLFFVNLVASASIILPVPAFLIVFAAGSLGFLNPWVIGLVAGAGAALGELIGYWLGKGGGKVIEKKYKKLVELGEKWIKGHKSFPMIVAFAATPLPDDIVGIVCGIFNYDIKKFLLASFIGKVIMNTAIAWSGFYGFKGISAIFGGSAAWLLIGAGVVVLIFASIFKSKIKEIWRSLHV